MPDVLTNRIALIAAAAIISAGAASAVAVAFPGRADRERVASPSVNMVATPDVSLPTAAPTPIPTPTPAPAVAPEVYTPRRSTTVVRTQPTRRPSAGAPGDVSQLPGPAQKAVGEQPEQPSQPDRP